MRTIMFIPILFVGFFFIIFIGVALYTANQVDDLMNDIDFTVAENTIQNRTYGQVYNETLGEGIHSFQNNADNWGIFLLIGTIILVVICGFVFNENQKLWLILEVLILIVVFIFATIFSYIYNDFINSDTAIFEVYSEGMTMSSTFILNLPWIIPIVWLITMILVYGRFRKKGFREASSSTQEVGF